MQYYSLNPFIYSNFHLIFTEVVLVKPEMKFIIHKCNNPVLIHATFKMFSKI